VKKGDHLAYSSFGQAREGDDVECSPDFDWALRKIMVR
jgi:hypothetical protein